MFILWFENLMDLTPFPNFVTEELDRCYWDAYHERKQKEWKGGE